MEQFRSGLNRGSLPNLELAAAVNVVAEDKVLRLVIGDSRRSDAAGIDLAFLDTGDAVQEDRSGTVAVAEDKLYPSPQGSGICQPCCRPGVRPCLQARS